jgi:hypothetical protein
MVSLPDVVGLISDSAVIADVAAEIGQNGGLLICNGCADVGAIIAAFLVLDDDQEAWSLCGSCTRKLSLEGPVI